MEGKSHETSDLSLVDPEAAYVPLDGSVCGLLLRLPVPWVV